MFWVLEGNALHGKGTMTATTDLTFADLPALSSDFRGLLESALLLGYDVKVEDPGRDRFIGSFWIGPRECLVIWQEDGYVEVSVRNVLHTWEGYTSVSTPYAKKYMGI